jgi:branched-chain amino acid transport system permease protein
MQNPNPLWKDILRIGLLGGVVALYLCLAGLVGVFSERPIITGVISLGHSLLVITFAAAGIMAARAVTGSLGQALAAGALAGALGGALLSLFVLLGAVIDIRAVFRNASPLLYSLLTFGVGVAGFWVPLLAGALLGALGSLLYRLTPRVREPVAWTLGMLIALGLFAGLLRTPMLGSFLAPVGRFLFGPNGLTVAGALITILVVGGWLVIWRQNRALVRQRVEQMPVASRRAGALLLAAAGLALVLALPHLLGPFVAQVVALVALYVLMGLGLNITLGFAGLLDLGFVAFFAVGAYVVGLLTSTAEFGLAQISFWAAVPVAIVCAMLFGAFLGLPILGIRGDYLAIATLGFGEIIRILAGSDLLKAWLGGPRGILNIPKPIGVPPTHPLAGPNQIYYIALIFAALVAFIAVRLRESRLGRTWMAVREDEDVAEALGVNLVQTKLLAYMLGAAFAGLSGAVFAGLVGSIFASSMQLFVSINVVALIIVGGMGSIPGVVVGAIFLIGLPELFREFSEYRFLFYGVALIVMMRLRPEGLLPSTITKRELEVEAGEMAPGLAAPAASEPVDVPAKQPASS